MGNYLRRLFFSKKLEVVIVGLGNSGKTTLLHVLSDGTPIETVPTVGLNVRMIKKGGVQMKCWDLAGGEQYRDEWGRFTKGCDVIIFVVDANAMHLLPEAKKELHRLLEDRELAKTALLIVANKIDLEPHASEPLLIRGKLFHLDKPARFSLTLNVSSCLPITELNLDYIVDNPWMIIPCSALKTINVNEIIQWLIKHADQPRKK
ncbi:GTP-binding protein [archaeon]|nr:MAG: GTP-binding protein [archaeon]